MQARKVKDWHDHTEKRVGATSNTQRGCPAKVYPDLQHREEVIVEDIHDLGDSVGLQWRHLVGVGKVPP